MRTLVSFLALLLALSCNVGEWGSMKSVGDDKTLSPGVNDAVREENVTKNEPPTVVLDPNDIKNLGLDLNAAIDTLTRQWTANPVKDEKTVVSDAAAYKKINLETATGNFPYTQVTRQYHLDETVDQTGQTANTNTMTFESQAAGILDVLLVIDSSGSMGNEQATLQTNLPNLLTHVGQSNWQIAVVNTEPTCAFKAPINKNTANYETKYKNMVNVGTSGSVELAVKNAVLAITGQCSNTTWLRNESNIAVIIVTDEPHQCNDSSLCGSASSKKLRKYLNDAISPRAASDLQVYGLVSGRNWGSSDLFDISGNVMDTSKYDEVFVAISNSVKSSLKSTYELAHKVDNIVHVKVDGTALDSSDYSLNADRQVITLNDGILPEDRDVEVEVKYTHGFKEYIYDRTLAHIPLANSVTVTVDGNPLASNEFTGCTANSCSVFPTGASAVIKYKENIALKSKFVLKDSAAHNIMMNTFAVKVNSTTKSRDADYTIQNEPDGDKAIVFTSPPAEGANIEVTYTHMTRLRYAHELHAGNVNKSITCTDFNDRTRVISCPYANGMVEFATDIATDKVLIHEKLATDTFSLNYGLEAGYIGSSIVVKCALGNGSASDLAYSISASVLSLDEDDYNDCKASAVHGDTSYKISIDYKTRQDKQDDFFIDYDFFTKHAGKYKFIYVVVEIDSDGDGRFSAVNLKEFNFDFDYDSAEDAKVAFLKTLPDNTVVKATVYLLPY